MESGRYKEEYATWSGRYEDEYATWRVADTKMNMLHGEWQIQR